MHPLLVVIALGLVSILSFVFGLLQRPVFRAFSANRTTVRADAPLIVAEVPRSEVQECRP